MKIMKNMKIDNEMFFMFFIVKQLLTIDNSKP